MPVVKARTDFALALNQICAERGIEPKVVLESIKYAMLAALRRDFGVTEEEIETYEAQIDSETGAVTIMKDGKDVTPAGFGRIAAQVAKQVIMQRVREAEKDAIIEEYGKRVGTMVTGMVLRFDGPNIVIDIGRGQGIMPPQEQVRNEYYRLNQRIAVYINDIRTTMKGKSIIVSRADEKLVEELFRREVPEVSSGAVQIKAIAREAGHRTKIAVATSQEGVDPVGSCVGQKGMRVQAVINELNGEKIDIIQHFDDPAKFIMAALSPAEGLNVKVDESGLKAVVTVPDDQLSLAIGKGGQNVRLAAKLTGYKIDILGETAKAPSASATGEEAFEIDELGLSTRTRNIVLEEGITTVKALQKNLDKLEAIDGFGERSREEVEKSLARYERLKTQQVEEQEKLKAMEARGEAAA